MTVPAPTGNAISTNPLLPQAGKTRPTLVESVSKETFAKTLAPSPTPAIPPWENAVVWVAFISLVGILVSLWQAHRRMLRELAASDERQRKEMMASDERLRTQLQASAGEATVEREQSREQANLDRRHAGEQAHYDRITKARREVYSAAVVAIVDTQSYISNLPSGPHDEIDPTGALSNLGTALAQVSILGEMDTVILARDVQANLVSLFWKAREKIWPIVEVKNEIEALGLRLSSFQKKIDQLDSSKGTPVEAITIMSEVYGNHSKCQQERIAAYQKLAVLNREYASYLLVESSPIFELRDELVRLIRTELALETDLGRLRASTADLYSFGMP